MGGRHSKGLSRHPRRYRRLRRRTSFPKMLTTEKMPSNGKETVKFSTPAGRARHSVRAAPALNPDQVADFLNVFQAVTYDCSGVLGPSPSPPRLGRMLGC